jgi:hypothetical protein
MSNNLDPREFEQALKVIASKPDDPAGSNLPNDMSPHEALHHGKNAALRAIDIILQHRWGISLPQLLTGDMNADPRTKKEGR